MVHVSPAANRDLWRVTSPGLEPLGNQATAVWRSLLRRPERFIPVHTENLFGDFDAQAFPALAGWRDYVADRYAL